MSGSCKQRDEDLLNQKKNLPLTKSSLMKDSYSSRTNTSTDKKPKNKKRKRSTSPKDNKDDEEALIDKKLEEKLQECAKRNNLTPIEIKKLLKSLVSNDHVLALVKIQEEEEIAREEAEKKNQSNPSTSTSENMDQNTSKDDSETCTELKLTRAKARQLNKKPIPIQPLNEKKPEPEVAALINQELNSDEEDDEYCPREEDYMSDDDPNSTVSDIDSEPRTPVTIAQYHETESPVRFTDDGLFKLPRERNDSIGSHVSYQEEIIAKRTRSKLCLQKTAIETIESNFIPPDITTDMYEIDCEVDPDWVQFLNEFSKPLNTVVTTEEDDEADPEYVAADKIPIDREELRDVNISKKELNDLIAELFDDLVNECTTLEDIPSLEIPKDSLERSPDRKRQKLSTTDEAIQQGQQADTSLNTPEKNLDDSYNSISGSQNVMSFNPNMMSTPMTENQLMGMEPSQNILQIPSNDNANNFSYTLPSNSQFSSAPPLLQQFQSSNEYSEINVTTVDKVTEMPPADSIPSVPYISLPVLIPTADGNGHTTMCLAIPLSLTQTLPVIPRIDLTVPGLSATNEYPTVAKPTSSHPEPNLPQPTATDRKKFKKCKVMPLPVRSFELRRKFAKECKDLRDIEIEDQIFPEDLVGFTDFQRQILDQQMRIHVQFAVQNFIQTYSHPDLWKMAQSEKDMLLELEKNCRGNDNSAFNAWNLKGALEFIKRWENELSVPSLENQALIEFFYSEIERIKKYARSDVAMNFPPRIMKLIVKSKVFMYPDLLPQLPFRLRGETDVYKEFIPSEDYVIAHAMQYFYKEIEEEKKKSKMKSRIGDLRKVCGLISKKLIPFRQCHTIYHHIIHRRNSSSIYNPIKFYYERGRAPPFKHILRPIDLENVQPPELRLSELPPIWKNFAQKIPDNRVYNKYTGTLINLPEEQNFPEISSPSEVTYISVDSESRSFEGELNNNPDNNSIKSNVIHFNYIFLSDCSKNPEQLSTFLNDSSLSIVQSIGNIEKLNSSEVQVISSLPVKKDSLKGVPVENPIQSPTFLNSSNLSIVQSIKNIDKLNSPEVQGISSLPARSHDNSEGVPSESLTALGCSLNDNSCPELSSSLEEKAIQCNGHDSTTASSSSVLKGQKLVTDFFKLKDDKQSKSDKQNSSLNYLQLKRASKKQRLKAYYIKRNQFLEARYNYIIEAFHQRKFLKKKLNTIFYWRRSFITDIYRKYSNKYLHFVYVNFMSLELYTNFLERLRMYCKKMRSHVATEDLSLSMSSSGKKPRLNDDKKSTKVNENVKQMLLTESNEEINKKDATFAFNFYEKVEETLKENGQADKFKKFKSILKDFDPRRHEVVDLYNEIENLFLPDYPDLVQIFLSFLLPSQAAEIGKFFQHFMLTNMHNFVNKLNIYFSKQPSQIKKVYSSLHELSEETELTLDKIKAKLLPLLKGNQFLTDWFLQMFPTEQPPTSLGTIPENINAKQLEMQSTGHAAEFIPQKDLFSDSPEQQSCQIRYINGRIFYGSRVLLPAKLAFIAKDLSKDEEFISDSENDERLYGRPSTSSSCVHHIPNLPEKIIKSQNEKDNCPDGDKSDDEDVVTGESEIKYDICDDVMHKKHAVRLNPSLYSVTNYAMQAKLKCESEKEIKSPKKLLVRPCTVMLSTSLPSFGTGTVPTTASLSAPSSPTSVETTVTTAPQATGSPVSPQPSLTVPTSTAVTVSTTVSTIIHVGNSTTTTTASSSSSPGGSTSIIPKEKRKSPKKMLTKSPGPTKKCSSVTSPTQSQSTCADGMVTTSPPTAVTETTTCAVGTLSVGTVNAIKAAKKLKAMMEEDGTLDDKQKKTLQTPTPVSGGSPVLSTSSTLTTVPQKPQSTQSALSPIPSTSSDVLICDSTSDSSSSIISVSSESSVVESELIHWTREEDKIILEEVKLGYNSEESLLERLKAKLTNRATEEILKRHQFLMDVLMKVVCSKKV